MQSDWNIDSQVDVLVDYIKFIDEMISILSKKTNGFRNSPLKLHQINWFNQLREMLSIILSTSYTCIEYDCLTYFAKKSLDSFISIIENLKLIFVFTKEEGPNTEEAKKKTTYESLLDHVVGYIQEGTDFSVEKVFETPHPYPKGEYTQKDTI